MHQTDVVVGNDTVDSTGRARRYRHVLCVYPYRIAPGGGSGWPPLGLEIIAAALQPHAESIDVVDLRCERACTADFIRRETDLVCFSVNWESQLDFVREQIRSVPPEILTIVGGRHATEDPARWLTECPNVDVVVRGDGEDIVEEIARGRPLDEVAGVSYRREGALVHNRPFEGVLVRDSLYPRRELRRCGYTLDLGGVKGRRFDTVSSSRGCPFNCRFCSFSRNPWGAKRAWSARSPESVVHEIEESDADVIGFLDDIFTHDVDRVSAICDLLLERGVRKRYAVNARIEIARRPDVLAKMARAGFSLLLLGIESAQDSTLRSMKKGFDTAKVREYFEVLRRSPMVLLGYFIVGNIGETEAQMRQIVPFARELGLDLLNLCLLRNETYSGLDELIDRVPGYHTAPGGDKIVYSDAYSAEHLRSLQRQMLRTFYTPGHVLHILKKSLRNGLVTPGMLAKVPWWLLTNGLTARLDKRPKSAWGTT
jgi:anaerobic magnesium-protoporphyrin IX monomethyl ester cyclase